MWTRIVCAGPRVTWFQVFGQETQSFPKGAFHVTFPGDRSGQRQKNSYLIELTTSRCSCFQVATSAWWQAHRMKYPVCTEALSLLFLKFLRPLEIEGQAKQRERLESLPSTLEAPAFSFFRSFFRLLFPTIFFFTFKIRFFSDMNYF